MIEKVIERLKVMLYEDQIIVYDNEQICKILGISSKVLFRYRCDGLLPYSRVGDKYWYSQEDLDSFMKNTHKDISFI